MLKLIIRFRPYAGYLLAATTILILIVSSIPSLPTLKIKTAKSVIRLDYFIHFCEYGFLAFLAFLTFAGKNFKISFPKYFWIALMVAGFAMIDEFHQILIPGRVFNPRDLFSNFSGIAGALAFCIVVFRIIARNMSKQ